MENSAKSSKRSRSRLWMALAAIAIVVIVLVVPPLVSIGRYKSQITSLMSRSLGRPVRLSSVEVRLLPWPGFVLTDLSVAEDPAYGAEPVLHASTVAASIRLLALWRGRLEIGNISVDEGQPQPGPRRARPLEPRLALPHRGCADRFGIERRLAIRRQLAPRRPAALS